MVSAGLARQGVSLATAIVLGFAATKSRQFSALQLLTLPALIPPALLQVPQVQYPTVAGLTHLAATGVDPAAQTASAAVMNTGKWRGFNILAPVRGAGRV
jgi:hypothetical protein